MRVLWVDADDSPWTDANGWRVLEDFGLKVHRVSSAAAARPLVEKKEYDLLLVRAEMDHAAELLVYARETLQNSSRRVTLISSTWNKDAFRSHSKTAGAAHRYARVPMPPEGFLGLVGDLFGCTVEEIADFSLPDEGPAEEISLASPPSTAPARAAAPARKARAASSDHETDDAEVLRQYLRIKEEQLEIAESERSELAQEHERGQKEAHALQARLREMEHQHEELAKKVAQMELARDSAHQEKHRSEEDQGRAERAHLERIRSLETQLSSAGEKYENLRVRVRKDIRKIRENERELEARLELLRKDSATLLQARDERVLEMQRKIDAMEFDLDQVQDGRVQAQMEAERYLAKLARVARALNVATGMIEDDHVAEEELEELEPVSGGAALAEEPVAAPVANTVSMAAAEPPPPDEPAATDELPEELASLANDGEPTQMIDADSLRKMGGDGE